MDADRISNGQNHQEINEETRCSTCQINPLFQMNDLHRFLHNNDVNIERVEIRHSEHFGYGLFLTSPISETDFLVLAIPERLFLRPRGESSDFTGFEQLISTLLEEKEHPYVRFLRTIDPIPSWRRATNERFPSLIERPMRKHLEKYQRSREKFSTCPEEEFLWAYYSVNTRCVHLDCHSSSKEADENLCLIPYLGAFPPSP